MRWLRKSLGALVDERLPVARIGESVEQDVLADGHEGALVPALGGGKPTAGDVTRKCPLTPFGQIPHKRAADPFLPRGRVVDVAMAGGRARNGRMSSMGDLQ